MGRRGEVAVAASPTFWSSAATAGGDVPAQHRLTLGEGATALQVSRVEPNLRLKREDANPTGSHKDRAASYQLAHAAASGVRAVTISSSGNAAIATSRYAQLHGIEAWVCVHPATDPAKLAAIDGATTTTIVTPRAINTAKLLARELAVPNLRPSVHDDALVGYATLGDELAALDDVDAIVLFATSGATAVAVAERVHALGSAATVYFVQGEGNAALADPDSVTTDSSAHGAAAGRLGVRRSRRSRQLRAAIEATGGRGIVAGVSEVAAARLQLRELEQIEVSEESAANYAVALQLARSGQRVVCVISGAPPQAGPGSPRTVEATDEHDALRQLRELPSLSAAAQVQG